MKLLSTSLLFASLSYALYMPSPPQAALIDSDHHEATREKVPGDNPAYYTREKKADQLFEINDFTALPNPTVSNHRLFFYLAGTTGTRELPSLADATLELWVQKTNDEDKPTSSIKKKISDFPPFSVRDPDTYVYGGPLVEGSNEIVGDFWLPGWDADGHGTVEMDVEAVARLPDERILFAFKGSVSYEV